MVGVVVCLERGADCLHMVQLMPMPPQTTKSLALFQFRLIFAFLIPAYTGCPRKEAAKRVVGIVAVAVVVLAT